MIGFQYFSGPLADDDAGSHGVAGRYARHDGCIGKEGFWMGTGQ
jgi:hypothetical protein